MRIIKFGVELSRLKDNELELVRSWRNSNHVRASMFFQEEITSEMHRAWFDSLGENDVYFMISHNDQKIGIVNVKQIDWNKKTGEAGVYIGNENYLNSHVSMLAIAAMMDVFFFTFDFTSLTAKVRKDNEMALEFNQQLGYQIIQEQEDAVILEVNRAEYERALKKYRSTFEKIGGEESDLVLTNDERIRFLG